MAERRSLTNAVSTPVPGVSPEIVRSFVTQNLPTDQTHPEPTSQKDIQGDRDKARKPVEEGRTQLDYGGTRKASRFHPVGLIPVTVRLRPEIAGALKRASLERELDGEEVFTQQDLVENALTPWLKHNGFLD